LWVVDDFGKIFLKKFSSFQNCKRTEEGRVSSSQNRKCTCKYLKKSKNSSLKPYFGRLRSVEASIGGLKRNKETPSV
jgi:hypothetical protein